MPPPPWAAVANVLRREATVAPASWNGRPGACDAPCWMESALSTDIPTKTPPPAVYRSGHRERSPSWSRFAHIPACATIPSPLSHRGARDPQLPHRVLDKEGRIRHDSAVGEAIPWRCGFFSSSARPVWPSSCGALPGSARLNLRSIRRRTIVPDGSGIADVELGGDFRRILFL